MTAHTNYLRDLGDHLRRDAEPVVAEPARTLAMTFVAACVSVLDSGSIRPTGQEGQTARPRRRLKAPAADRRRRQRRATPAVVRPYPGRSAAGRSRVAAAGGDGSGAAVWAPGLLVVGRRLAGGLLRLCGLRVGLAAQSRRIERAVAADLARGGVKLLSQE